MPAAKKKSKKKVNSKVNKKTNKKPKISLSERIKRFGYVKIAAIALVIVFGGVILLQNSKAASPNRGLVLSGLYDQMSAAADGHLPKYNSTSCFNDTQGYYKYRRQQFCFLKWRVGIKANNDSLKPHKAVERAHLVKWMRMATRWLNNNRSGKLSRNLDISGNCYAYWIDCGWAQNKGERKGMAFVAKQNLFSGWDVSGDSRDRFRPNLDLSGDYWWNKLVQWRKKID